MAIEKHKGYNTVKKLIEGNQLHSFQEIFEHVPKTTIYQDLGINYFRFTRIITDIKGFKLEELYHLANLIGVDEKIIIDLAHSQYLANKAKKKKG